MPQKKNGGLLLVALLIAGCGFHLRGADTLPLNLNIQAEGGDNETLGRFLRQRLASVQTETAPAAVLTISSTQIEQRVVSIDPQGVAREFLLILHSRYHVQTPGQAQTPEQVIELQRDYNYNSTHPNPLATELQAQALREELLREGAEQILRTLRVNP